MLHSNKHIPSMCELYFELRRKKSKIRIDRSTPIFPTCHSTVFTTIPIFTLPTPCKSCILFTLLHQNTQDLWWDIIINNSLPNPHTQYHPLSIILKNTSSPFHRAHTPLLPPSTLARTTLTTYTIFLPLPTQNPAQTHLRDTYDRS